MSEDKKWSSTGGLHLNDSAIRFAGSMNGKTTTDGDEILYLDEINDDLSRPLKSSDLEAVHPPIGLRAGFSSEVSDQANNPGSRRPSLETELDNLNEKPDAKLDGRPALGFDLRNGPELQPNWTSGPIFPSSPPTVITTPDVNVYQHKKTLAQGMMDLALLSANANQMRYVLQTDGQHPYFYPSLTMIGMSLFLQIAVGIGLIWNSVYNIKQHEEMCKANKANNWTVIGIFLVTILNVFISSFGVIDQPPAVAA